MQLGHTERLTNCTIRLAGSRNLNAVLTQNTNFIEQQYFNGGTHCLPTGGILRTRETRVTKGGFRGYRLSAVSILAPLCGAPRIFLQRFLSSFIGRATPGNRLYLTSTSSTTRDDIKSVMERCRTGCRRVMCGGVRGGNVTTGAGTTTRLTSKRCLTLTSRSSVLTPRTVCAVNRTVQRLHRTKRPSNFLCDSRTLFAGGVRGPLITRFGPSCTPSCLLYYGCVYRLTIFQQRLFRRMNKRHPRYSNDRSRSLFLHLVRRINNTTRIPRILCC